MNYLEFDKEFRLNTYTTFIMYNVDIENLTYNEWLKELIEHLQQELE